MLSDFFFKAEPEEAVTSGLAATQTAHLLFSLSNGNVKAAARGRKES